MNLAAQILVMLFLLAHVRCHDFFDEETTKTSVTKKKEDVIEYSTWINVTWPGKNPQLFNSRTIKRILQDMALYRRGEYCPFKTKRYCANKIDVFNQILKNRLDEEKADPPPEAPVTKKTTTTEDNLQGLLRYRMTTPEPSAGSSDDDHVCRVYLPSSTQSHFLFVYPHTTPVLYFSVVKVPMVAYDSVMRILEILGVRLEHDFR